VVDCFLISEPKGSIVEITVYKGCRETVLSVDGVVSGIPLASAMG
jgi:hypothetical protein